MDMLHADQIYTVKHTEKLVGANRNTLHGWSLRGEFPRRVQLSPSRYGYRAKEVHGWLAEKIAARDRVASEQQAPAA